MALTFWFQELRMIVAFPVFVATLLRSVSAGVDLMFLAIFCLFFNTGPSNTALANVSLPAVRAMAFAANIFVIHALGDCRRFGCSVTWRTREHACGVSVCVRDYVRSREWYGLRGVKYLAG